MIWEVLAKYEGLWVAVDKAGKVVAQAGSLSETTRLVGGDEKRVTFLYAAAGVEAPPGRSRRL